MTQEEFLEVEKIRDHLLEGERVLVVAKQSRFRPGGALSGPNTVFATDRRLLIRNPTMLGLRATIEEIPYDAVTSIKREKGLLSSTLVIRSPGLSELSRLGKGYRAWGRGEEGSIDAIPKGKAEKILRIVREGMQRAREGPPEGAYSVADEIRKLAELRDAGIVTEKEFEERKRQLLRRA